MNISNYTGGCSRPWKSRWLPGLVNVLLVFGLAMLFTVRVQGFDDMPGPGNPRVQDTATGTQPANAHPHGIALTDTQRFGVVDDVAESRAEHSAPAPDTVLELYLKGIVATDDHHLGYAIIRSPDQQEWHFGVGDSVYGLATLEEIHIDRVILLRDGQYETLRLPIESMLRDTRLENARKLEAKRIVSDFRSKLMNRDGMALIRMFGFEETYKNGGFMGFTVKIAGEDGARMLEVLGVEEGDVVTAVNGKRFSAGLDAIQSLSVLKDATKVDVEIDRQGVPMFFHFEFDQLDAATGEDAQAAGVGLDDATVDSKSSAAP